MCSWYKITSIDPNNGKFRWFSLNVARVFIESFNHHPNPPTRVKMNKTSICFLHCFKVLGSYSNFLFLFKYFFFHPYYYFDVLILTFKSCSDEISEWLNHLCDQKSIFATSLGAGQNAVVWISSETIYLLLTEVYTFVLIPVWNRKQKTIQVKCLSIKVHWIISVSFELRLSLHGILGLSCQWPSSKLKQRE